MHTSARALTALVALSLAANGCAPVDDGAPASSAAQPIISGITVANGTRGTVRIESTGGGMFCSGTLLTNNWVLTAAHCFNQNALPANGAITVRYATQTRTNAQLIVHPTVYTDPAGFVDVALIRVASPFTVGGTTNAYQQSLYAGTAEALLGAKVTCLGYGNNVGPYGTGTGSGPLRQGSLVVNDRDARDLWLDSGPSGVGGICQGDSGGACFLDVGGSSQLVGVNSFTDCVSYSALANPTTYRDWVLEKVFGATAGAQVACLGPACRSLPAASLPNGASVSRAWNPCAGGCFRWRASYNMETNYDFLTVNGVSMTGASTRSGEACGSVTVTTTTDASVASAGYSLTARCTGTDIGVLADGVCADPEENVSIHMTDEAPTNNSYVSGWVGSASQGTILRFCRLYGSGFAHLSSSTTDARNRYSVLRLGSACPNGSFAYSRRFDNEDVANSNWATGWLGPNTVSTDTTLQLCFFGGGSQTMTSFPVIRRAPSDGSYLPIHYGVLGPSNLYGALASGTVYTDDEDSGNINQLTCGTQCSRIQFSSMMAANNTYLYTTQVR